MSVALVWAVFGAALGRYCWCFESLPLDGLETVYVV